MYPGKDPYFVHYYRINFDGTALTTLTQADAHHDVSFSPDMKYYVDTYSRVDMPNVSELRRAEDGSLVGELEQWRHRRAHRGRFQAARGLRRQGRAMARPTSGASSCGRRTSTRRGSIRSSRTSTPVRTARSCRRRSGRSARTPPATMSACRHSPSSASSSCRSTAWAPSNRSKAFHDVAWKNLGDAGFPDRILWHKAVAAKYPYYDITRVGIYGGSAGGQNSTRRAALPPRLLQGRGVVAGCHDNRMDKIWWNEQWMGWPLGEHYARVVERRQRVGCRASCCSSSASWTRTSIRRRRCRSSTR